MSAEDRLRLIEDIWDSLSPADLQDIPETHRQELDRRLAEADANPATGAPWTEVKARLQRGK